MVKHIIFRTLKNPEKKQRPLVCARQRCDYEIEWRYLQKQEISELKKASF